MQPHSTKPNYICSTHSKSCSQAVSPPKPRAALGISADHGGQSYLCGDTAKCDSRTAALINGVAAHAYELDDSGGCDHSGAVVVPALLAYADGMSSPVRGGWWLHAMIQGYEVGRRVLEACGGYEPHNGVGWHSTGTCGAFGATTATTVLMHGDSVQMGHCPLSRDIHVSPMTSITSMCFAAVGKLSKNGSVTSSEYCPLRANALAYMIFF